MYNKLQVKSGRCSDWCIVFPSGWSIFGQLICAPKKWFNVPLNSRHTISKSSANCMKTTWANVQHLLASVTLHVSLQIQPTAMKSNNCTKTVQCNDTGNKETPFWTSWCKLTSFSVTFPWLSKHYSIFHDFPWPIKFSDFFSFPWPVGTLKPTHCNKSVAAKL